MNRFLSRATAAHVLQKITQENWAYTYDPQKHRLEISIGADQEPVSFRLPLALPFPALPVTGQPMRYVILLVQSGSAALGYFEDGKNLDHKVIRAYMVRKKQGSSQIKYLKTKGKSRAGSRVRLGETAEFFEQINTRLQTYFQQHQIDRIAISCSHILQPYLYKAQVATPFEKRDPRLYKIPMHVHTPIYEVMLDVNKFLLRGELIYDPAQQDFIDKLLPASESNSGDG